MCDLNKYGDTMNQMMRINYLLQFLLVSAQAMHVQLICAEKMERINSMGRVMSFYFIVIFRKIENRQHDLATILT